MLKAGTAARRHSLMWDEPQTPDQVRMAIETLLRNIDARLQTAKADWVGHVKVLVTNGAESAYGSLTTADDQPRWAGLLATAVQRAELTVYAAIYALTDAQVAAAVDGALAAFNDQQVVVRDI